MRRRVAVTGMGVVCPLGGTMDGVWDSALAGRSAIAPLTLSNAATAATITIPAATVPGTALRPLAKPWRSWPTSLPGSRSWRRRTPMTDAGSM